MDWAMASARRDEKRLTFAIWCVLNQRFDSLYFLLNKPVWVAFNCGSNPYGAVSSRSIIFAYRFITMNNWNDIFTAWTSMYFVFTPNAIYLFSMETGQIIECAMVVYGYLSRTVGETKYEWLNIQNLFFFVRREAKQMKFMIFTLTWTVYHMFTTSSTMSEKNRL